jgi:hypothetical protein
MWAWSNKLWCENGQPSYAVSVPTHRHGADGLNSVLLFIRIRTNILTDMSEASCRPDSDSPETIPIFQPTSQIHLKAISGEYSWNHYECKQNAQCSHISNEPRTSNFPICIHRLTQLQTSTILVNRKGQVALFQVLDENCLSITSHSYGIEQRALKMHVLQHMSRACIFYLPYLPPIVLRSRVACPTSQLD